MTHQRLAGWLLVVCATLLSCEDELPLPEDYLEQREPCAERDPLRQVLWGDLHVHTSYSFDAISYGNRLEPGDAYRFARGESVLLPPLDDQGRGTRSVALDRPLDFVGVTDHGEFLGEVSLCSSPGSPPYDSQTCQDFRSASENGAYDFGVLLAAAAPQRFVDVCGADGLGCQDAARLRWEAMQAAAEAHYDRSSACEFTAFPAYEYTNTKDVSNLHRNVLFASEVVPPLPVTHMEASTPLALWEGLREACSEAGPGCDVLVLPHNSNLSNGQLFTPDYGFEATLDEQQRIAALRAEMEPVVEVFQHKGDSECRNGFPGIPDDPQCDFEKLRSPSDLLCGDETGTGGMRLWGCSHRLDFVRNVLGEGLVEEARLGLNPYRLGFIGSTDTHNGTPGMVDSYDFPGHVGVVDDTDEGRLADGTITHDGVINNPGGLTAVWSVANDRESIFSALRRREVFASSGPRIPLRFFGGWDLPADLCGRTQRIAEADERAVPMGAVLSDGAAGQGPTFFVEANWDPGVAGKPGALLQQIQVVKVWLDEAGVAREQVLSVAGDADNGADVDKASCEPMGAGYERLCSVWTDPEPSPSRPALYYARVLENPSCRWSTRQCLHFPSDAMPSRCTDGSVPRTVQQRVWSSPIWVEPSAD